MRKHIRKITAIMLALLYVLVFSIPALADDAAIASASIPISVSVSGEEGTLEEDIPKETYTYKIEGLENAPMPASNTLTIDGAGQAKFDISYSAVGVYKYVISQDASALEGEKSTCNDRGHYDKSQYYVVVTVQNITGGYEATVGVHKDSFEGTKTANVEFKNTYDPVKYTSITVKKTWTDNTSKRPSSIYVQLKDGKEKVGQPQEIKAADGWTRTWEKLDAAEKHDWNVEEIAVKGYTPTYGKLKDGVITIHNTGVKGGGLIQTGQLNWPIPVMALIGCLLIAAGIYAVTRKKEKHNG